MTRKKENEPIWVSQIERNTHDLRWSTIKNQGEKYREK